MRALVATWLGNRPWLEKERVGEEFKSQLAPMVRQADKEGASET